MIQYIAVLFDLDGTLLDALDDLTDAVNFSLQHNGMPAQTRAAVHMALVNLFETLLSDGQKPP